MFAFLLAVPIIAVEIFVVRPFFPIYDQAAELIWWSLFAVGWLFLAAGDGLHFLKTRREIREILRSARAKKHLR